MGKPSVSRIEVLSSNLSVLAKPAQRAKREERNPQFAIRNSSWKGSLIGKAVVLKTTALVACRFDSCPFRHFITGGVA